ncbi:MAG: isocitrate/isopropylmalate family dehydrogenase, partial [Fimbriimonadales bacterium]|nr:isocitrate/isopropylmalate family dehydrogenase [Fimbriimonadales bacterium]
MSRRRVTLIRGDGIGPEITETVVQVFEAAGVPIEWEEAYAGLACLEKFGDPMPDATLESIRRNRIALKGPTTTPIGTGHRSINVAIRKAFDLFANVRPARSMPGVPSRYSNVDIILVRENIEDTYAGVEYWQTPDVTESLRIITRPGSLMVTRYAFEMARRLKRRKITCVHKANIHKTTDGLFLQCFREVAQEYPELEADDILIDNACLQLVTNPERFDVMILPNLFGDIVSDLCAGLVGGLGVAPGGNIGNGYAVFEAVHGSAPDIAGKGIANPTAILLSAIQMLHHMGLHDHAERIETALRYTLVSGIKTRDLGGNATTREFTLAIITHLPNATLPVELAEPPADMPLTPLPPPASTVEAGWQTVGVDIFVHSTSLPLLPAQIGALRLVAVSNRGVPLQRLEGEPNALREMPTQSNPLGKTPPPQQGERYLLNWYRARYLAEGALSEE